MPGQILVGFLQSIIDFLIICGAIIALIGIIGSLVTRHFKMAGVFALGIFILIIPSKLFIKITGVDVIHLISELTSHLPLWLVITLGILFTIIAYSQLVKSITKKDS